MQPVTIRDPGTGFLLLLGFAVYEKTIFSLDFDSCYTCIMKQDDGAENRMPDMYLEEEELTCRG